RRDCLNFLRDFFASCHPADSPATAHPFDVSPDLCGGAPPFSLLCSIGSSPWIASPSLSYHWWRSCDGEASQRNRCAMMTAHCPLNSQGPPLHPIPVNSYLVKPYLKCGGMTMQFTRVISPVGDMEVWNASSNGFSFVISYENRSGRGFHGRTGFMASWRP